MKTIIFSLISLLFLLSACTIQQKEPAHQTGSENSNKLAEIFEEAQNGDLSPFLEGFIDKAFEEARIESIEEITQEQIISPDSYGYNTLKLYCNETSDGYELTYSSFTGVYHYGKISMLDGNENGTLAVRISYAAEEGEAAFYALLGDDLLSLETNQFTELQLDIPECRLILVGNDAKGTLNVTIACDQKIQIRTLE